jgi:hypothetical protein
VGFLSYAFDNVDDGDLTQVAGVVGDVVGRLSRSLPSANFERGLLEAPGLPDHDE